MVEPPNIDNCRVDLAYQDHQVLKGKKALEETHALVIVRLSHQLPKRRKVLLMIIKAS